MIDNNISYHPKWGINKELYYFPNKITKVIIGTMPIKELCTNKLNNKLINFFYGSNKNYFWKIVYGIYNNKDISTLKNLNNIELPNIDKLKEILIENKIGMIDIIESCYRFNDNSSDNNLIGISYVKNMDDILKKYNIKKIFFTSIFSKDLFFRLYVKNIINDKIILKNNYECKYYRLSSPTGQSLSRKSIIKNIENNYKKLFKEEF